MYVLVFIVTTTEWVHWSVFTEHRPTVLESFDVPCSLYWNVYSDQNVTINRTSIWFHLETTNFSNWFVFLFISHFQFFSDYLTFAQILLNIWIGENDIPTTCLPPFRNKRCIEHTFQIFSKKWISIRKYMILIGGLMHFFSFRQTFTNCCKYFVATSFSAIHLNCEHLNVCICAKRKRSIRSNFILFCVVCYVLCVLLFTLHCVSSKWIPMKFWKVYHLLWMNKTEEGKSEKKTKHKSQNLQRIPYRPFYPCQLYLFV